MNMSYHILYVNCSIKQTYVISLPTQAQHRGLCGAHFIHTHLAAAWTTVLVVLTAAWAV